MLSRLLRQQVDIATLLAQNKLILRWIMQVIIPIDRKYLIQFICKLRKCCRLGNIQISTTSITFFDYLIRIVCRVHHYRKMIVQPVLPNFNDAGNPIFTGHVNVEEQYVGNFLFQKNKHLIAVFRMSEYI